MKKTILKTSLITLGVSLIALLAFFGVFSLCAPHKMSDFMKAIGLDTLSGDYAYQEYERSGDIEYLARSFEIAVQRKSARKATDRFEQLVADDGFSALCEKNDAKAAEDKTLPQYGYRNFVYGSEARMKYRLAKTEAEKRQVCEFTVSETNEAFESGNPVTYLAVEAISKEDRAFCDILRDVLENSGKNFNREAEDYQNIIVKYLYMEEANE